MNSHEMLAYIASNNIKEPGAMEAFRIVLDYMFTKEKRDAKIFEPLDDDEKQQLKLKKKIEAIKLYNKRCDVGLIQSRKIIEDYMMNTIGSTTFFNL
jgi:hypothetical protein